MSKERNLSYVFGSALLIGGGVLAWNGMNKISSEDATKKNIPNGVLMMIGGAGIAGAGIIMALTMKIETVK